MEIVIFDITLIIIYVLGYVVPMLSCIYISVVGGVRRKSLSFFLQGISLSVIPFVNILAFIEQDEYMK